MNGWHIPLISTVRQGELPCAVCGVSTIPDPTVAQIKIVRHHPTNPKLFDTFLFTRCGPHAAQFAAWSAWATRSANNIAALGGGVNADLAAARAESLACAASLLGFDGSPGVDLLGAAGLMQHPVDGPAWSLRFIDYAVNHELEPGRCAEVPFGFVTREAMGRLRLIADDARALAEGKPRLIHASEATVYASHGDDVILSGCFGCGAPDLPAPFPGAGPEDVWTAYDEPAMAFGQTVHRGRGAGRVHGVLCGACRNHVEAGNGVGGWLPTSLLAGHYGLSEEDQIVDGPALLWAGHVLRARRVGAAEPTANTKPWQHLPRDEDGELVRPRTAAAYRVPELPRLTGEQVLATRLNRLGPEEAAALMDRLQAAPEPVVAAAPEPPTVDQAKRALIDAYNRDGTYLTRL